MEHAIFLKILLFWEFFWAMYFIHYNILWYVLLNHLSSSIQTRLKIVFLCLLFKSLDIEEKLVMIKSSSFESITQSYVLCDVLMISICLLLCEMLRTVNLIRISFITSQKLIKFYTLKFFLFRKWTNGFLLKLLKSLIRIHLNKQFLQITIVSLMPSVVFTNNLTTKFIHQLRIKSRCIIS